MQMSGEYRIEADRDAVWAALNDPEVLKQAIPGCQEIDKISDTEFAAKVKVKVGPVSAKFNGKVAFTDLDPPNGYTISGAGKGGPAGFAKGGAKVRLEADGAATILHYEVDAQVGGKLAQIGSRLIDATAKKLAGDFFANFAEAVGGPAPEAAAVPAEAPAAEAAPPSATGVRPLYWVLGLIAAVVILLAIFA
ncbi:MAG: SRPBCC family protein [Alphaproteobacteria bacterium]